MIIFIVVCHYKNSIVAFTAEFLAMVFDKLSDLKSEMPGMFWAYRNIGY